jgi:hypothetical protein
MMRVVVEESLKYVQWSEYVLWEMLWEMLWRRGT